MEAGKTVQIGWIDLQIPTTQRLAPAKQDADVMDDRGGGQDPDGKEDEEQLRDDHSVDEAAQDDGPP